MTILIFKEKISPPLFPIYLRILEQVDSEVVDRTFENLKSNQEVQHTQLIKDQMRITDVPVIVENLQVLLVGGAGDLRAANMVEKVLFGWGEIYL